VSIFHTVFSGVLNYQEYAHQELYVVPVALGGRKCLWKYYMKIWHIFYNSRQLSWQSNKKTSWVASVFQYKSKTIMINRFHSEFNSILIMWGGIFDFYIITYDRYETIDDFINIYYRKVWTKKRSSRSVSLLRRG